MTSVKRDDYSIQEQKYAYYFGHAEGEEPNFRFGDDDGFAVAATIADISFNTQTDFSKYGQLNFYIKSWSETESITFKKMTSRACSLKDFDLNYPLLEEQLNSDFYPLAQTGNDKVSDNVTKFTCVDTEEHKNYQLFGDFDSEAAINLIVSSL